MNCILSTFYMKLQICCICRFVQCCKFIPRHKCWWTQRSCWYYFVGRVAFFITTIYLIIVAEWNNEIGFWKIFSKKFISWYPIIGFKVHTEIITPLRLYFLGTDFTLNTPHFVINGFNTAFFYNVLLQLQILGWPF